MPGSIVGGGASLLGAGIASSSASSASKAQEREQQQAIAAQQQAYGNATNALSPYTNLGSSASSFMNDRLGTYTNNIDLPTMPGAVALPGSMTQDQLAQTPGYQFTLSQGLKGVQNSAAAKGLGLSGAALKGAAQYATGLADSTYKDQFGIQQQQYQDALGQNAQLYSQGQQNFTDQATNIQNGYNRLLGLTNIGGTAANALAGAAMGVGSGIASSYAGIGNAQAASDLASGKAFGNAFTTLGAYGNKALNGTSNNAPGSNGNNLSNSLSNYFAFGSTNPYS